MVHLSGVHDGTDEATSKVANLSLAQDDDTFTTTVYGSRFAQEALPKHKMPDCEMPRDVAYRMIKDELSLDGNPKLKYVTPHRPELTQSLCFFYLSVQFIQLYLLTG